MTRNEFVNKMKEQLDEFNRKLDDLEKKRADYGEEARARFDKRITELKEKRREASKRLDEINQAGDKAWEDLKTGATAAWKSLQESFEQARSHFK
jgi:chromosome segregation ATPase